MIKFRCEHCGQKLGVPEQYAGKAVRCTGCKQGVRVPALEVEEPEPALEDVLGYEVDEPAADSGSPFDDLDMLGGEPAGLNELPAAPASTGGGEGSCPKCGASVGPQAVICIHCGHNLKSGGKMKTKVGKEKVSSGGGGAGVTGRTVVSWLVGGVVAGVGGLLWFVVFLFGFELGLLAWGIGGLTGFTVAAINRQYSVTAGIGAAVVALSGISIGKGLIYLAMLGASMLPDAVDTFGNAMKDVVLNDPVAFRETYSLHMHEERLFEPELQARIDAVPEDEFFDEQLINDIDQAAASRISAMSQDDKQAFVDEMFSFEEEVESDPELAADVDELRNLDPLAETFSLWDLLWFPLALGTAYQIGRGNE